MQEACATTSSYRRPRATTAPASGRDGEWSSSFDVLSLLAELVDRGLECEPHARQRDVRRFRAERVRFTIEFLRQEIELSAHGLTRGEQRFRLAHMCLQAIELLADVGLHCQKRHFLRETLLRHAGI